MKCKRCGKVEGFDGSFHTLYCQSCLNELLKEKVSDYIHDPDPRLILDKKCSKCGIEYPNTNEHFHKNTHYCVACTKEYMRQYFQKNKEKSRLRNKQNREENRERYNKNARKTSRGRGRKYRIKAIEIYGGKCIFPKCNISDKRVLEWHHRNGRKTRKDRRMKLLREIIKEGKPLPEYQLLCANHHIIADLKDGTGLRGSCFNNLEAFI